MQFSVVIPVVPRHAWARTHIMMLWTHTRPESQAIRKQCWSVIPLHSCFSISILHPCLFVCELCLLRHYSTCGSLGELTATFPVSMRSCTRCVIMIWLQVWVSFVCGCVVHDSCCLVSALEGGEGRGGNTAQIHCAVYPTTFAFNVLPSFPCWNLLSMSAQCSTSHAIRVNLQNRADQRQLVSESLSSTDRIACSTNPLLWQSPGALCSSIVVWRPHPWGRRSRVRHPSCKRTLPWYPHFRHVPQRLLRYPLHTCTIIRNGMHDVGACMPIASDQNWLTDIMLHFSGSSSQPQSLSSKPPDLVVWVDVEGLELGLDHATFTTNSWQLRWPLAFCGISGSHSTLGCPRSPHRRTSPSRLPSCPGGPEHLHFT